MYEEEHHCGGSKYILDYELVGARIYWTKWLLCWEIWLGNEWLQQASGLSHNLGLALSSPSRVPRIYKNTQIKWTLTAQSLMLEKLDDPVHTKMRWKSTKALDEKIGPTATETDFESDKLMPEYTHFWWDNYCNQRWPSIRGSDAQDRIQLHQCQDITLDMNP